MCCSVCSEFSASGCVSMSVLIRFQVSLCVARVQLLRLFLHNNLLSCATSDETNSAVSLPCSGAARGGAYFMFIFKPMFQAVEELKLSNANQLAEH